MGAFTALKFHQRESGTYYKVMSKTLDYIMYINLLSGSHIAIELYGFLDLNTSPYFLFFFKECAYICICLLNRF